MQNEDELKSCYTHARARTVPQYHHHRLRAQWDITDAEIKDLLSRNQTSAVLLLKQGVGQNIAMHASSTANDFFLELMCTFPVHSLSFLPKPFPSFSPAVGSCGRRN